MRPIMSIRTSSSRAQCAPDGAEGVTYTTGPDAIGSSEPATAEAASPKPAIGGYID
jgi:hypothetical protein